MKTLKRRRILLVDDEPDVRAAIAMLLDALGAIVSQAQDGRQALDMFREQPFDAVITDYNMPDLKGDALAKAIKSIRPTQWVIMITGYADQVLEDCRIPVFIDELLPKPCTKEDLAEALEPIIHKPHGVTEESPRAHPNR